MFDIADFEKFEKCNYVEGQGKCGFYQEYNRNGRVIREGYKKFDRIRGEIKQYSDGFIHYDAQTILQAQARLEFERRREQNRISMRRGQNRHNRRRRHSVRIIG